MPLPGKAESCWIADAPETRYPRCTQSHSTDVVVIGGGIVGLTTAYLLTKAGYEVTVLEACRIGRQVTGRSTAKITSQHALVYAYLIEKLGSERARLYGEANHCAVELIFALVRDLDIDCDLERKSAYAYTLRSERRVAIEAEARAARMLGFDAEVLGSAPLPFANAGALRFGAQAQFNPTRYLVGLAAAITESGGRIFERARVTKVDRKRGGKRWRAKVGRHYADAENIVVASHIPIAGPVKFDERTRPRCHIAMAFRATADAALDGIFIDIDTPSHSLRMGRDRDGELLIVLGPSFPTGHDGDIALRFRELEQWVRSNVPCGDVVWRWVNEDYDSPDRVPFAGELSRAAPGMFVATGFNGWGISNGTAAAMLIADQMRGEPNPWWRLYDPVRRAPKHFNRGGDSKSLVDNIDAIKPGTGGVIDRGKQKIAVWKSPDGKAHALSAACTHMGCTVTWNNADLTWDCPCHGSMFTCDGRVIHGPATEALKPIRLPAGA